MTDYYCPLIERLRVWPAAGTDDGLSSTYVGALMTEAAAEIARLRAEPTDAEVYDAAIAIAIQQTCGCTFEGRRVLCNEPSMEEPREVCECLDSAQVALRNFMAARNAHTAGKQGEETNG